MLSNSILFYGQKFPWASRNERQVSVFYISFYCAANNYAEDFSFITLPSSLNSVVTKNVLEIFLI